MKPTPRADFYLVVRDVREEDPEHPTPDIYAGIYEVFLNHQPVSIVFIPAIDDLEHAWPPTPPHDIDDLRTSREARLATLATADYAVLPNQRRAGELARFDCQIGEELYPVRVWFIDPERFERLAADLSELADDPFTSSLHEGKTISELCHHEVVRFIVDEVVLGDWFSKKDRELVTTMVSADRGAWPGE